MKTAIKSFVITAALGGVILTGTSCKKDDPVTPTTPNVVELAQSDTSLSILVAAVSKAGLVNLLSTTSNITVFAPTNAAFRAAGYNETVINGLSAADVTNVLTPILAYHVVTAKVASSAVPVSDTVKTYGGKNVYASRNTNGVFINGYKVTTADLNASNGVVHKINGVLIPPTKTIAQIVIDDPNFSTLEAAVIAAGLAPTLSGAGKFTVFAPTNAAFVNAGVTTLPTDPAVVAGIVGQHAFATNIFASDLTAGVTSATVNPAATLTVALSPAVTVKVTGSANPASNVTATNIVATNGVIHVIDRVLL